MPVTCSISESLLSLSVSTTMTLMSDAADANRPNPIRDILMIFSRTPRLMCTIKVMGISDSTMPVTMTTVDDG